MAPPSANQDTTNVLVMVNIANGLKARIYQFDNTTIADENGTEVELKNRRVVEGLHTLIISLTQLINEGWIM